MGVRVVEAVTMYMALVIVPAATIAATGTNAPRCARKCGNLDIPYPFGTSDGCRFNSESTDFLISCNTTSYPHKAFLGHSNIPVTNISLADGEIQILQYVAYDCYDGSGTQTKTSNPSLTTGTFTVSPTKNKFMAMGCDTIAYLRGWMEEVWFNTGCMSYCYNSSYVQDSCSGVGCCQTTIPGGLRDIQVNLESFGNYSNTSYFDNCSHAFVVVKEYNFSRKFLQHFRKEYVPMVLDWTVGNETCEVASRNKTSFPCKANSVCVNRSERGATGYYCKCMDGYEGNPYTVDGCKDIDECSIPSKKSKCEGGCVNLPGSYTCSCPEGHNLLKDGKSCSGGRNVVLQILLWPGLALSALVLSIALFIVYRERKTAKHRQKHFQQNGGMLLRQKLTGSDHELIIFREKELRRATRNYRKSRILGRGGQGTVYKGILPDNTLVAIKKSRISDITGVEQFVKEIFLLSQIQHDNVVKILGCCLEADVPLLVYEFVNNGSLSDHMHKQPATSSCIIQWETRLKIAAQTAAALSHLHSSTSGAIVHRDVKLANILLDENCNAKVSDFGASRLMPTNRPDLMTLVHGTMGYLDPEYFHTNQLTSKSDVYSFGVVLIELLTGEKVFDSKRPADKVNITVTFLSLMKEDRLVEILDRRLLESDDGSVMKQLKEVAEIAQMCVRVRGQERPTMAEVADELQALKESGKRKGNLSVGAEEKEHLDGCLSIVSLDAEVTGSSTGIDSINEQVPFDIQSAR